MHHVGLATESLSIREENNRDDTLGWAGRSQRDDGGEKVRHSNSRQEIR